MKTKVYKLDFYKKAEDIFELYKDEPMAMFLDSSLENQLGRYSVIGFQPYLIFKEENGIFYKNDVPQEGSIEQALKQYLEQNREENPTHLPLVSGGLGYFSYDYGRKFEQIKSRHEEKVKMPEALFVFHTFLLIDDKEKQELYLTVRGETEEKDAVSSKKDPYEAYRYLRTHNPAPFGGFFQCGDFQVVSASPERFMQVKDGCIETRPIKGTRKRGETPQEDQALKEELKNSSKDRSELLMIVDLERNDLNHVCEPGSVRVTEHFAVETYATVFHLVTTIVGKLQEGLTAVDLIPAAFPGGSITGAPKIRAMEIIDELEHDRRNLYTGSMGYFSFDGNCDLNIVIRTAIHKDGVYHLGVGGGITCESDLEFEYEETLQKAKAVLEALWEEA